MADVEARREARRRKILANSEKRLKRISGIDGRKIEDQLDDRDQISLHTEGESTNDVHNNLAEESSTIVDYSSNSPEVETIFQNSRTLDNESLSSYNIVEKKEYVINRNLCLLILPTILSCILVISTLFNIDVSAIYLNKVFIPFIIFEVTDYFFGPVNNASNFISSLMFLANVRNRFLAIYIEYLQYFLRVMQDLMIYFFVFTLTHTLLRITLFGKMHLFLYNEWSG